jgi:hypothetical protein
MAANPVYSPATPLITSLSNSDGTVFDYSPMEIPLEQRHSAVFALTDGRAQLELSISNLSVVFLPDRLIDEIVVHSNA